MKTTELQLNHINCESTDSESDTENTISINMINVENDYEPIIYEQTINSHIYQNHDQLLLIYCIKHATKEKIEKIVEEITKKPIECLSTNNIYQNIPKEPQVQRKKYGQSHFF